MKVKAKTRIRYNKVSFEIGETFFVESNDIKCFENLSKKGLVEILEKHNNSNDLKENTKRKNTKKEGVV